MRRLPLADAEVRAVRGGQFVRVAFGERRTFEGVAAEPRVTDGATVPWDAWEADSAFVGRLRGGAVVAYANRCPHLAAPLDVGLDDFPDGDAPDGTAPAPLADDGEGLLCLRHGALFGLADGRCTAGPCVGEHLLPIAVDESDGGLALLLP